MILFFISQNADGSRVSNPREALMALQREENKRYIIQFKWRNQSNSHIIMMWKSNRQIVFYDPQPDKQYVEAGRRVVQRGRQLERYMSDWAFSWMGGVKICPVSDLEFNTSVVSRILEEAKGDEGDS